ncbi:MAG: DUF1800 domain-containing protein [Acidimicrobiia bacterium]|nr:DUF1800 domain-containing protein [Acidimicrobiia bacterium]
MPTPAADIALLLRRAGFGGTSDRIAELAALDLDEAVQRVLDPAASPADTLPTAMDDPALADWQKFQTLANWWLDRMATSPAPIVEKMTLFWHGHFTTSYDKVFRPAWIASQHRLYRRLALGNLRELAQFMCVEPAMLDYLDNWSNRKGRPNENFARELMELFLLGVGHYDEADVLASARAWTGHTIDWDRGVYTFDGTRHDTGTKAFLGLVGDLDGPQVVAHILDDPTLSGHMARFLCTKLWEFFAHPSPPAGVVDALADVLLADGHRLAIRPVLQALFTRPEFYAPASREGHVRSPAEYVVAILRATGLQAATAHPEWFMADMGQRLFNPPDVSGWKLNEYWVSTASASAKANWAHYLTWVALAERRPFVGLDALSTAQFVQVGFDYMGITEPSPATRAALERWVSAQRAAKWQGWALAPMFFILLALTPDLQLA